MDPIGNVRAVTRMASCRPAMSRITIAADALGLEGLIALHAGPPFDDPTTPPAPTANAVATAALYEGWAGNQEDALALLAAGKIRLAPAQDHSAVVPLAAVITPSMQVVAVEDLEGVGEPVACPLNGGMNHANRFGVCDAPSVQRLKWLNREFAPALRDRLVEPVALLPIAGDALEHGDDCHGNTAHATGLLGISLGGDSAWSEFGSEVEAFMRQASSFFLNPWMAASRCVLSTAEEVPGSDIVVGMGGNGRQFGLRLSGQPRRWFTIPAMAPSGPWRRLHPDAEGLPAIGDSAVVESLGLGAVSWCQFDRVPGEFAALVPAREAQAIVAALGGRPIGYTFRVGLAASRLANADVPIPVSLGVLEANVGGMLGRGVYHVPPELLRTALSETTSDERPSISQ